MERTSPYTPEAPVSDGRRFVGRQDVLVWIWSQLEATPAVPHLVVAGPARVGKTSLLWQIQREAPDRFLPIYVDMAPLQGESLSRFYLKLAETAVAALKAKGIAVKMPVEAAFVDAPHLTFEREVLQPAFAEQNGRTILFLFDHLTAFTHPIPGQGLPQQTLADFAQLLQSHSAVRAIFALSELPVADDEVNDLAFLADAPHYTLSSLSLEAGLALIRQERPGMVHDVARYIFDLTGGYPAAIQRVGHALHRWQEERGIHHLTVADVATAWQNMSPDARNAVKRGGILPTYRLEGAVDGDKRMVTPRRPSRFVPWGVGLLLLAGLLALLIWGLGGEGENRVTIRMTATPAATSALMIAAEETAVSSSIPPTRIPSTTPSPVASPSSPPTASATASATASLMPSPTATATTTPTPGRRAVEIVRERDGMPMRFVPGGSFMMGSEENDVLAAADETPKHLVLLDSFYMDQYEVSAEQYAAFLNQKGAYEEACDNVDCVLPRGRAGYTSYLVEEEVGDGTVRYASLTGYADYPVNHVSWYGAAEYCKWVDARLPSEAEWEYAARGSDERLYPWGNEPPDPTRAVYRSRDFENMKAVDALPAGASPFDIYGLAGSLWEWTADWYDEDYYEESPSTNPTGPESGFARVLRGGSWPFNNEADRIRAANRWSLDPTFISATVGFRCARSVNGER